MKSIKSKVLVLLLIPFFVFAKGGGGGHGGGGHGGGYSGSHSAGHSYSGAHSEGHGYAHSSFGETHEVTSISHEGTSSFKNIQASGYNSASIGKSYIGLNSKEFTLTTKIDYSENQFRYNSPYKYRVNSNVNYNLTNLQSINDQFNSNIKQYKINNFYIYNLFFGNNYHYQNQDKNLDDSNSLDLSILNTDFAYVNDGDDGNDDFNAFDLPILGYQNYQKESFENNVLYMTSYNNQTLALLYPNKIIIVKNNIECSFSYALGQKIIFSSESELLVLDKDKNISLVSNLCNGNNISSTSSINVNEYDKLSVIIDLTSTRTYFESNAIWVARNTTNIPIILYRSKDKLAYNFPTFDKSCLFLGSNISDEGINLKPVKCAINQIEQLAYFNNKIYLNTQNGIYSYQINGQLFDAHSKVDEFKNVFPNQYKEYQRKQIINVGLLLSFILFVFIVFVIIA